MDSAVLKTFQQCFLVMVLVGRCAFGFPFCTENTCVPPELCQEIGRCWIKCRCGSLVDPLQNWTRNKAFASTLAVGVPSRIFFQGEGLIAGPSPSLKCTSTLLKLCSLKRLWCLHYLCLCSKVHAFNGWLWICSRESNVCILSS